MATSKKTQIVITANASVAKKVMDELAQRTDAIKQKMAALDVTTKKGRQEFNKLKKELDACNSAISQNITDEERVKHAIDNLSTTSLRKLRIALASAKKALGDTFQNDPNLKKKQQDVRTLQAQIDKLTGSVHKQGGAWKTAMKSLTAYVGLFGAFNMIKQKVTDIISLNLKYSDSLANVRKVSNLSMDSVNDLSRMLAKVDSRTSLEGLTQLAYVGSRMGMGKYGAEGLAEFAQASDRVNVALKEDLGDDAMLTLSKFVETMGEVEKHGGNISSAFDAVSSSIFKLASTSTANGNNILEFAKRLTGLSKVSHITSDQLLGLASASDSLMLMPEVASTAFGKLISSLWTNYHDIEKMLGMQENSLKGMMEKGQTMQALVTVLENVSNKNLNSMDAYFKEFGSDGQRLKQVVVTMAQNVDVLKSHLKESSEAYEDATAVQKEYAIQQETAQALLKRANNMWSKAFVNPEGIDVMKEIAKAWYDFSKSVTQSQPFLVSVEILMWGLKTSVTVLLAILPGLVAYLGTRGLVWAFSKLIPLMVGISGTGIIRFFSLLTSAVMGSRISVLRLIVSWKQMSIAMKANVIGLAISLVAELGMGIYSLVKKTDDATESVDRFNSSLDGVQRNANQAQGELDAYYNAIRNAKKGSKEYSAAMKIYNDKFGQYFKNLKKENGAVLDLAESYRQASRAIQAKIYLESMQEDRNKYLKPRMGWALDRLGEYGKVAPAGFGTSVLKGFEEDNSSKSMSYIIGTLAKRFGSKHAAAVLASIKRGDKEATTRTVIYNNSTAGGYTTEAKQKMAPEDQRLFYALRYIMQARSARHTDRQIINKYAPVQGEITDYVNSLSDGDETLGGGKSGGGSGHHNTHNTKDDKLNKQEQQAKTRANALVSNIKAFYEEQKRKYLEWVTTMNADGEKVSEGQQQQMLDYIDTRMSTALGKAKQSIAKNSVEWEKFLQEMPIKDMMVETDETSKDLIEAMKGSNIKELHDLFEKLSGDLSKENHQTLSENLGALLDQIFANGSKELREAAEKLLAQQREIQKILNENDYTGAVNRDTRSNFDKLGFLKPAKDLRADSSSGLQQMSESFDALTTKARTSVTELYKLNPASDTFKSDFLEYLSVANEGFDFSALNVQKLKALYYELIKYTESYTEAEKRQYDKAKKIIDFDWSKKARNKEVQDRIKLIETQQKMYGKQSTFGSNLGLTDIKNDPEIALMKARMQAAEDYYFFVKQNTDNQKLREEAEHARYEAELAYVNQVAASMKERLSQMKSFVQPIEDFGAAVGQALATMKDDAKSANEAIKSALKSMLESWGKMALDDVNKQMWQAINNAGVNRAKEKAKPDIKAARMASEKASSNGELNIPSDLGTAANPIHAIIDVMPLGNLGLEDKNGNPTGVPYAESEDHKNVKPVSTEHSPSEKMGNAPASPTTAVLPAATNVASQTGEAAASVATGQSTLGEAVAGMAGSAIGTIMNTDFGSKQSRREKREQRKQQREAKKHQKELTKEAKKGVKEREKLNKKGNKEITKSTEEESKAQVKTEELKQNTTNAIVDTALNTNFQRKKKNDQQVVEQSKNTAQAENTFSIVGAVGKCFEFLGPIAGPIAAAAVMALLTGLMQWGLNAAFGGKKDKNNSPSGKSTKIVSGMLTYDSGNVQDMKPFVADNGEIYWAEDKNSIPQSGVNLLTNPTATTINGQRSLVAENGPELVVGRETTRAMMMNNPSLLKALVNYDRNYSGRNAARRTFDEGNISEATGSLSSSTPITEDVIANSTASNVALLQAVNVLLQRLNEPISAKIDMYGRGNLYDSMTKANQFMKNKS